MPRVAAVVEAASLAKLCGLVNRASIPNRSLDGTDVWSRVETGGSTLVYFVLRTRRGVSPKKTAAFVERGLLVVVPWRGLVGTVSFPCSRNIDYTTPWNASVTDFLGARVPPASDLVFPTLGWQSCGLRLHTACYLRLRLIPSHRPIASRSSEAERWRRLVPTMSSWRRPRASCRSSWRGRGSGDSIASRYGGCLL